MDEQYVIIFEDFDKVLIELEGYTKIHLIYDDFLSKVQIDELVEKLAGFEVVKSYFPNCRAAVADADAIEFLGEQIVLSVGGVHVSSLAKYYACSLDLDFALVAVKEIAEFSFSAHAFLQDTSYCFFETQKPKFVFVKEECFSQRDCYVLLKALLYKNIVLFEKEFEHDILQTTKPKIESLVKCINLCDGRLKSIIKIYGLCANMLEENNPYDFLGAEYVLLSLLCCNKKQFSENLIIAQNLLFKFFECFLKFDIVCVEPDINLHLKELKQNYKISFAEVCDTIAPIFDNNHIKTIKYRFDSFLPFLREFFEKCSTKVIPSKIDLSSQELSMSLALCADLFAHKNILRLARDFGYFEKLLKY